MTGSLLAVGAGTAARAQTSAPGVLGLKFNPHLSFGIDYTDNVRFVENTEDQSDSILRLEIALPLVRDLKRGSLSLSYGGTYSKYETFDALDNLSHRLGFDVATQPSPRSSLGFGVSYRKTQDQGEAQGLEDLDLFLSRRTDRESLRSNISYRAPIGAHWGWTGTIGASTSSLDEISMAEEQPAPSGLEDRDTLQGEIGFYRERTSKGSFGFEYGRRIYDLQNTGKETVQLFSLRIERRPNPDSSVSLRVGGFVRDDNELLVDAGELSSDSKDGVQGSLQIQRALRRVNLGLTASHEPSSGGARSGTSTNSLVGLTMGGRGTRRFGWSTSVRFAQRASRLADQQDIDSISFGASIRTVLFRNASLGLGASYVDQTGDSLVDRGSYYRAGLRLSIHRRQTGVISSGF